MGTTSLFSADASRALHAMTDVSSKIKPQPNFPPSQTLYLSNIDWAVKKPQLKRSLLSLFSRHGKVLDVICLRGNGSGGKCLRGQAWVIFDPQSAATQALTAERGFVFFGRPLMVNYSAETSDRIAKRNGTYGQKTKEKRAAKRKMEETEEGGAKKSAKTAESTQGSDTPSPVLLAKDLPDEVTSVMLEMLFRQYGGYKEVKMVDKGSATIEFGNETEATTALKGLNGFKLTTSATLDLTYYG